MTPTKFSMPQSRVRACYLTPHGRAVVTHNDALPWWGYVAAKALSEGGFRWRIRKVYIEFENVADPDDVAAVPTVTPLDPDHALPYYQALADSPSRDYLRVDLRGAPALEVEAGYENYFEEADQGNLLLSFAQTTGILGVNGLPFNDSANSKVYGTALVAAPVETDPTQDIVVARAYFEAEDQLLKLPGMQIGISWESPFVL
jgi:hypothetical protein